MKKFLKKGLSVSFVLSSLLYANQTITIHKGWNLIGIIDKGVNNQNLKLSDIIDPNKIETIYNPQLGSIDTKYLKYYKNEKIEPGKGYWIKSKEDNLTLNIKGNLANIDYTQIITHPDWNLIAFNSKTTLINFINQMTNLGFKIETIYNPKLGSIDINYIKYYKNEKLNPNSGYWVKVLKQIDSKEIGNSGKRVIVYVDKASNSNSNLKDVTIKVAGYNVKVKIPSNATKAEIRIVDEYNKEIAGGIVLNANDIQNGEFTIPQNKISNLNSITSVAYYVLSANPSGVPQPLSGVNVYDENHNLLGSTDANGIVTINASDTNQTLIFEKDGFSINSDKFNTDSAVKYIFLSPANEISADELSSNTSNNSNDRLLNRELNKYYAIKTLSNKAIGIVKVDNFSANHLLSNVKFIFSSIDKTSFYGKDKLSSLVGEYEKNGIKYVPHIITGVQALVKVNGKIQKGDKVEFSNIDETKDATITYYLPNFFVDSSFIKAQENIEHNVKFYAFDGENWKSIDKFRLSTKHTPKINKLLKKIGYKENQLIAEITDNSGIRSIIGVLYTKEKSVKTLKNIKVKVVEEDGTPIKNALVKVLDKQVLTNENGIATFDLNIPKDLVKVTFEANEPHHYRNFDNLRINDLKDNETITLTLLRPPATGTIDINTLDKNNLTPISAVVDIITPAVLSDVKYDNGTIKVGKESTAIYHWYIKPNNDTNSKERTFRILSNSRTLNKLKPNVWTEVTSGKGKNSITIGELLQKLIQETDVAIGSVKIGVWVEHQNGINDGNATNPVEIGQADILFNENLLEKLGLEKINEDPLIIKNDGGDTENYGITGTANSEKPYIAFTLPSTADINTLEVTWYVLPIYEKDSDNQYYWNGTKWVKSSDLSNSMVDTDYKKTVYNIAQKVNFAIKRTEKYIPFNKLVAFLSNENIIKGLFIKKSDVDENKDIQNIISSPNENSVLKGIIRLAVIADIKFKNSNTNKIVEYVDVVEAQLENINAGDVLHLGEVTLRAASILPHHIVFKTSEDGLGRVVNIPFTFGYNPQTNTSYLEIMAKKAGYLDSDKKPVPKFEEDNPNTSEFEDVANVNLMLKKIPTASLELNITDSAGKKIDDVKVIVPSSKVDKDKIVRLVAIDNKTNDDNNEKGIIKISDILAGGYIVNIFKDGYKPANISIIAKPNTLNKINVTLEKIGTIHLTKPFVNNLEFNQLNDQLTISGNIIDTKENNYSNAATANIVLNNKVITISINKDGSFSKSITLDRGINKVKFYVTNVKGSFITTTKTYIYLGETAYMHGYILGEDKKPKSNAIIKITDKEGNTIYRVSNSNGKYEVNDMPIGDGVIDVTWYDENGLVYTATKRFHINNNITDYELNVTLPNTTSDNIDEPAKIYIDTYNGGDFISEVSTDTLDLVGRVENFDKENGAIIFTITYGDGTSKVINLNNKTLKLINKENHSYVYSISLPLKEGVNYIDVKASNPLDGGEELSFVVNKKSNDKNITTVRPLILVSSLSGLPVYATVSIKKIDGTPVGVFDTSDYNNTYTYAEPELIPNKYYIFDITADRYNELIQPKKITQDTKYIYFALKPVNDIQSDLPTLNNQPPIVSELTYTSQMNYYEFTVNAYDPDGDTLTYTWYLDNNKVDACDNMTICNIELSTGEHTIKVDVNDDKNTTSTSINVNVTQKTSGDNSDIYPPVPNTENDKLPTPPQHPNKD